MRKLLFIAFFLSLVIPGSAWAAPVSIQTQTLQAGFDGGRITSLTDLAGNAFLSEGASSGAGVIIHRENQEHVAQNVSELTPPDTAGRMAYNYSSFADLDDASATAKFGQDNATGDLAVSLECQSAQKGVAGVEWRVGPIPADMNIIIPGYGGIKLTADSSTTTVMLQYPMFWEAQFLIVEGKDRGFYLWSDDTTGRYKRLYVTLKPDGWWIGVTTWNNAPFDDYTTCQSVTWRVNTYEGDWRVPARKYSEWARENMPPVADGQPAWVKDIRSVVILFNGPSIASLDMLAKRVDPGQTLVYVPDWRPDGYDRLYPNYEPVAEFGAFVEHAHSLGFKVMPHFNYFGIDPDHPLYEQFKAYHVRDAWGNHDQQWFIWDDPSNPINNRKLGYINPAHKPWRELLIGRIKQLYETYHVDAVYLDQTLNIFNDYNGLCDDATMLQGNLSLGQELRNALPELGVGGEGINEVTARYLMFCQRHAWGIDFVQSSWNKPLLKLAHPVSTYLFRPVITFNYLGVPPPDKAQYYAAWRENLVRWGVIPTLMVFDAEAKPQTGFLRQLFDEVKFWQTERVDPDMDGVWPKDVVFPYKTAQGQRAERLPDGRLMFGDREISRTVTDVFEVRLPGTIEGSLCYDNERILGLNPDLWYPYFTEARDMTAFHVEALPSDMTLRTATQFDGLATLTTTEPVVAYLPAMIAQATTGSVRFSDEQQVETKGALNGEDGSQFASAGNQLHAHPPWKTGAGSAFARWNLQLPLTGSPRFVSTVALDPGRLGTSDGVVFGVTARHKDLTLHNEILNTTEEKQSLELDLMQFAGQEITLELTVHPGAQNDVTADWARWYDPRVVGFSATAGSLTIYDPAQKTMILSGTQASVPKYENNLGQGEATFPGTVMLLRDELTVVSLPVDLTALAFLKGYVDANGQALKSPAWASAAPGEGVVGSVMFPGLKVQPPDLGQTIVVYALSLPVEVAQFHCFVGLEDGSKSTGVDFIVLVNGIELVRQKMLPGELWREMTADLSPWAGKPVVLSLVTDAAGSFGSDWARWGKPVVLLK